MSDNHSSDVRSGARAESRKSTKIGGARSHMRNPRRLNHTRRHSACYGGSGVRRHIAIGQFLHELCKLAEGLAPHRHGSEELAPVVDVRRRHEVDVALLAEGACLDVVDLVEVEGVGVGPDEPIKLGLDGLARDAAGREELENHRPPTARLRSLQRMLQLRHATNGLHPTAVWFCTLVEWRAKLDFCRSLAQHAAWISTIALLLLGGWPWLQVLAA
eukprot:CAMPEP_0183351054 /NCGR_PEP_ID=MMETSP0164_2-20130417/23333_1 /TAXON_ID=221442 /ORGANISM="Coccolithus pelagicus ssp braarudi, Strain PLY182g" /LENGTH=215 /DNA_ID=CAMNT_0025523145 /DNA_START=386 /DNA_END=1033 /DNA_ORIENTATION=-